MSKRKLRNRRIKPNVVHDETDLDYLDDSPNQATTDKWKKEWETSGEFNEMDFRLVDDE